jgi:TRAP transporter TAXI family solute receptor
MIKHTMTALAFAASVLTSVSAWSQTKDIRWGTGPVGSAGHKALVVMADLLNKEMPKYRIAVLPTPGAVTTIKGYNEGEYDGIYGSDIAFQELATDSGRFKGYKANMKKGPVQSFWTYTIETGIGILASNKDKIKSWSDLTGKKVYTGPIAFDTRANLERALADLGVKHNYVQVDLSTVGSQLQSGSIDATIIYSTAESVPVPWLAEASLTADWMALNPTPQEVEKLKAKNVPFIELPPSTFKRDTHTDKVILSPFFFGFDVGLEMPEADVYQMLIIIEKHAAELAKADESFSQIAKNMADMQKRGVQSSVDLVPIHPGLAKWMREKGVWDAKWDAKIAAAK